MCNTMCNNHTHEEYNIDYINREEALDIQSEDVPCQHEQNIYVIDGEYDENGCNCNKCSKCSEPKKVSCRSLACRQLNDECSCRRRKVRKTTMVNVLENNVMRLEDKMNNGCADMHENIEAIEDNLNLVYNELKDEEARAKQQEAFLHYGLDDAVTRAWYNPEDRHIHFYHKNPANCLNVNVNEGCDCDCCNACGCECKCNNDECQSDIPYTMDDDCNIIPMSRDEEELPFSIDCTDFLKDIFISEAYIRDDEQDNPDKKHGPILVIKFKRTLEPEPTDYDNPDIEVEVDLSKVWNLENYYDKDAINELANAIFERICAVEGKVSKIEGDINNIQGDINNIQGDINNIEGDITNINQTTQNLQQQISNINTDVTVVDNNPTLNFGQTWEIGTINGDKLSVTMPVDPTLGSNAVTITNLDPTLDTASVNIARINDTNISAKIPNVVKTIGKLSSATSGKEALIITPLTGEPYTIELPQPADQGIDFDHYVTGATIDNNNVLHIQQNGGLQDVTVPLPVQPEPKHITNITQEGNVVTFEWSDNSTPTTINVGGACVWKEEGDHVIPVNTNMKVHGAGFYDTTVTAN